MKMFEALGNWNGAIANRVSLERKWVLEKNKRDWAIKTLAWERKGNCGLIELAKRINLGNFTWNLI